MYGRISKPGMAHYHPWIRELLTLDQGESPFAQWLYEPQPISSQPTEVGSTHRVGRYGPEGLLIFVSELLEL